MHEWKDTYIEASEDSISIMINNILRNAIIHSPTNSEVYIDIKQNNGKVILQIEDNGPGIATESRDFVLKRFHKAKRGSKVGTGLGLAIVKRITDLHGADLQLSDSSNKTGLKVTVLFDEYKSEE